tara:strand:- start:6831 stop:7013 length:183 start_codon:yes stop_codon:yes gene_type:complete
MVFGKKGLNDKLAVFIYILAMYISLSILDGLVFDVLGVAFLVAGLYGILVIYRGQKLLFE